METGAILPSPRVLIADDERDLVEMVAFTLGRKGYETSRAYDGEEAWEKIKEQKFDLLILDLMMPGLDGWEVCRLIRQNAEEKIREIPILILSARAMAEDRVQGLEMGADDYLTKPFSLAELTLRIENIMKSRRALNALQSDLKALRRRNLGREDRLRNMIHDLKTPLLSMGASAKLLMKPRGKEETLEMLRGVYESSLRLNRRLEEIFLISQAYSLESGLVQDPIDLPLLLEKAKESLHSLAIEKNIEIRFHPLPLFPLIWGYEGWMESALENLLGNALKYSQEGGMVEVGGSVNPEAGKMEIWVQDNGRGILPEDIERIFEPFQRGRNALNEPGMGLGLSLVKQAADLHGGEVRVQSEPGKGSLFSLRLPMKANPFSGREGKMG